MNLTWEEAKRLLLRINSFVSTHKPSVEIIVAPSFPFLDRASEIFLSHAEIASQNISQYERGAYTGEISAEILKSIGVSCSIIGHSERRTLFNETPDIIAAKTKMAVKHRIKPIVCCGETLQERERGNHKSVVKNQIETALDGLTHENMEDLILAYEPVWAIGTGHVASPSQAQEMHKHIRNIVGDMYGSEIASKIRILYGGSVKPGNAEDLFSQEDIDGGLIGGASLDERDFTAIISSAARLSNGVLNG